MTEDFLKSLSAVSDNFATNLEDARGTIESLKGKAYKTFKPCIIMIKIIEELMARMHLEVENTGTKIARRLPLPPLAYTVAELENMEQNQNEYQKYLEAFGQMISIVATDMEGADVKEEFDELVKTWFNKHYQDLQESLLYENPTKKLCDGPIAEEVLVYAYDVTLQAHLGIGITPSTSGLHTEEVASADLYVSDTVRYEMYHGIPMVVLPKKSP